MIRKTNQEIKQIIKDCFMKSNGIFNTKAIMKETGLMRETVMTHKDEVIKAIRDDSKLVNEIKKTMV